MKKLQFINGFWLKLIAIIAMTIDHLGLLISYNINSASPELIEAMRTIGRLALPLYAFMISEGAFYSKNKKIYLLRLSITAAFVSLALFVITEFIMDSAYDMGNIFIDLTLGALACILFSNKRNYIKPLCIIPLAVSILSYYVKYTEYSTHSVIEWYPYYLRCQYDFYSVFIIFTIFFIRFLFNLYTNYQENNLKLAKGTLQKENGYRVLLNISSAIVIVIMTIGYMMINENFNFNIWEIQYYAILASVPLLFYNGKRGYSAKWFEYGCYLYYPLHIGLLYLIFYIFC